MTTSLDIKQFNFGKYKGHTFLQVWETNPNYMLWVAKNIEGERGVMFRKFLNSKMPKEIHYPFVKFIVEDLRSSYHFLSNSCTVDLCFAISCVLIFHYKGINLDSVRQDILNFIEKNPNVKMSYTNFLLSRRWEENYSKLPYKVNTYSDYISKSK